MNMKISKAIAADLPRMETAAREFYASSRFLVGFDMERFTSAWASLIESCGVIFLAETDGLVDGALGGVAYPDINSGALIATEFFWFMRPGRRGAGLGLYRRFEQWARNSNCSQIRMVHLADGEPQRMAKLYKRLGFDPAEVHYVKELKP